jgi:hypothetical protein
MNLGIEAGDLGVDLVSDLVVYWVIGRLIELAVDFASQRPTTLLNLVGRSIGGPIAGWSTRLISRPIIKLITTPIAK